MEQEIRKILRCPICEKGRIADAPAGAALSQYRLFAMVGDEPADIRAVHYRMRCGTQNAFPEGNGQTDAPGQATLWRWCGGWYCD